MTSANIFARFWKFYSESLVKNPYTTKCTTSFILLGGSDALSSVIQREDLNYKRMFAIGAYGAVFVAPFAHNWLILLEKIMPVSSASSYMFPRLVGKVSTDLGIAGTIITYSYLLWRGIIEGNTVSDTNKSIAETFWPIYKANLYVWFPAQLMNFMLVPLPYRVLYHNSVLFAWNTYLAYEASKVFAKDPITTSKE